MGTTNTNEHLSQPDRPRGVRPSLSYRNFSDELVKVHNATAAKTGYKILLFGCNGAKSDWFNGTTNHQTLIGMAYHIQLFDINHQLRRVKTLIYDTADDPKFLKDTIKYIPSVSPNGIILTYNTHDITTLNHLKKSLKKIKQSMKKVKTMPFLLLAMHEIDPQNKNKNCIDIGQQFANKERLFHLQIDMKYDIKTQQPYIYLLRKILNMNDNKSSGDLMVMLHDIASPVTDSNALSVKPEPGSKGSIIKIEEYDIHKGKEKKKEDRKGNTLNASTFHRSLSAGVTVQENIMSDIVDHMIIQHHSSVEGLSDDQSERKSVDIIYDDDVCIESCNQKHLHTYSASAQLVLDRVHSRIPQRGRSNNAHANIPTSFRVYKRKRAENNRIMNSDSILSLNELLWDKYVAQGGDSKNAETFRRFCESRGHIITSMDAIDVVDRHLAIAALKLNVRCEESVPYASDVKQNEKVKQDVFGGDAACHLEFERFFVASLGEKRSKKYLSIFKEKCYNDIRLIDPEIFDDEWFKSDDIKMDLMDKKLFKKEVIKYKKDCIHFENMLDEMKMKEKYLKQFMNVGIATLWSFYYHIGNIDTLQLIITDKQHSLLIWDRLRLDDDEEESGTRNDSTIQIEGNRSDSEDMYQKVADKNAFGGIATSGYTPRTPETPQPITPYSMNPTSIAQPITPFSSAVSLSQSTSYALIEEAKHDMMDNMERDKRRRKPRRSRKMKKLSLSQYEKEIQKPKANEKQLKTAKKRRKIKGRRKSKNKTLVNDEKKEDIMSLDEVQKVFTKKMGHKPKSVQQLLSYCQQHNIGWRFRDINKWWRDSYRPDK